MITIYSKDTTSFLSNGLGALREFTKNPIITEELNENYILEFSYKKDGWLNEYLIEENIIKANGQPFRIYNIDKNLKETRVLAKHIAFDLNNNFLEDVYPQNLNGFDALTWVLNNAQESHNFTAWSDITSTNSARYVRKNFFEAFLSASNSLVNRWGGEFEYDNYTIKLHTQRGANRGLQIRHGKNLTGVEMKVDFSTVVTRIMPQGINNLILPEKYIDSPLINNYQTPIIRKIEFDVGVDPNTTELEAQQELRDRVAKLYADGIDEPELSIKIDFIELSKTKEHEQYSNLESVYLGDTVGIYIESLGLETSARVVKIVYDCLKERNVKVELGSVTPNYVNSQSTTINNLKETVNYLPSSVLTKAQNEATETIRHPFGGYIYFDENEGCMYIMDDPDVNSAQSIWKWGLGGLGYSPTGVNGTYTTAMTQDGQIVANFITTGTMSTARIEGLDDTLSLKVGSDEIISKINLSPEEIIINSNKISLEGYTTVNDNFSIDENGNVKIGNSNTKILYNLVDNSAGYNDFDDIFYYSVWDDVNEVGVRILPSPKTYSGNYWEVIEKATSVNSKDLAFLIPVSPSTDYNLSFLYHGYLDAISAASVIRYGWVGYCELNNENEEWTIDNVIIDYATYNNITNGDFQNHSVNFTTGCNTHYLVFAITNAFSSTNSTDKLMMQVADFLVTEGSAQLDWTLKVGETFHNFIEITPGYFKTKNTGGTTAFKMGSGTIEAPNGLYINNVSGAETVIGGPLKMKDDINLNGNKIGDATETDLTKLNALTATATELNYVDGVTSAIQTQLDSKLNLSGGTMTGDILSRGGIVTNGLVVYNSDQDPNTTLDTELLTRHANTPDGGSDWWYVTSLFFDSKTTGSHRVQEATGYGYVSGNKNKKYIRNYYGGSWSVWVEVITTNSKYIIKYSTSNPNSDNVLFNGLNLTSGNYRLIIGGRTNTSNDIRLFINGNETDDNYRRQTIINSNTGAEIITKESNALLGIMYDGTFEYVVDIMVNPYVWAIGNVKLSATNYNGATLTTSIGTWVYINGYISAITSIKLKFTNTHARPLSVSLVKLD